LSKLVTFIPTVERLVVTRKRKTTLFPQDLSLVTVTTTNPPAADASGGFAGK